MCNQLGGNNGLKNPRQGTQQGFADQSRSGKPCPGLYNQILRLDTVAPDEHSPSTTSSFSLGSSFISAFSLTLQPASVFLINKYSNKHNPKYFWFKILPTPSANPAVLS
ncbi:hypothetical protein PTTG_05813 [Puccinia triticina 1-1 BBBD Race 1]|uniref:Uncharacterized protein n=1 Tax=Puccinia triticina (isolate 1-1 / race 1 (BBBD)) TaxID=630390 RepID=A0A0C4EYB3_PUCT1|nr:hypothetical protein PTTG_05813 [Puccinia triticina 1-1 BBBD Race 1]